MKLLALQTLMLCVAGAEAEETTPPIVSFKGFGTLGMARSSENQADFTSTVFKPNGAGHTRRWSADVDSLLAMQGTANPSSQLSAVLQLIAEQNSDNSYRPHVEWVNIKYQFSPDFNIRAGRTVLPVFLLSETRKLAYSYSWVRPPREVYNLVPISHSDGVDTSYRLTLGEVSNTFQASFSPRGTYKYSNGQAQTRDLASLSYTAESGPLTIRFAIMQAALTITSVTALFDAFRQFGMQGTAIADHYDANGKRFSFRSFGASYDPGDWFMASEWGQLDTQLFLGKLGAWYVGGGYRVGPLTPFLIYAQARADRLSDPGLSVNNLPPAQALAAAGLNAALNSLLKSNVAQRSVSIGARWDLLKTAAIKLQFEQLQLGEGSNGVLNNTQSAFQTGGRVRVLSASIDFVF